MKKNPHDKRNWHGVVFCMRGEKHEVTFDANDAKPNGRAQWLDRNYPSWTIFRYLIRGEWGTLYRS